MKLTIVFVCLWVLASRAIGSSKNFDIIVNVLDGRPTITCKFTTCGAAFKCDKGYITEGEFKNGDEVAKSGPYPYSDVSKNFGSSCLVGRAKLCCKKKS